MVLAFTIFPVLYNLWLGFYDANTLTLGTVSWTGFHNYLQLLRDSQFWTSLRLGVIYALGSTFLQTVVGIAGALIVHTQFPGRNFLRGVTLFPYMIPTVISVFIWRWLMNDLYGVFPYLVRVFHVPGMPTAWLGPGTFMYLLIFISVWEFSPFVLLNVLARLQTIPSELYEAARADGASPISQFVFVTLPQLRGVLLVVILLRGIWMFNKFDVPWLLAFGVGAGESIRTVPVFTYQRAFLFQQAGMGAALSNVMSTMLMMAVIAYFISLRPEEEA